MPLDTMAPWAYYIRDALPVPGMGGYDLDRYRCKSTLVNGRGYWHVRCRVYDLQTGKVMQRRRSTGLPAPRSKRKAQAMIPEIECQVVKELDQSAVWKEPVLADYISIWLDKKSKETRENTMSAYHLYADKHILPVLGQVEVRKLRYRMLQDFYNQLGKSMKSNSLKKIHCVVKGALDEAVRDELIAVNPGEKISFPKQEKFVGGVYTVEQMKLLFAAAKEAGEPIQACVVLAGNYGLRREEVLGLRWKDIDFERGYLHIRNTVTSVNGKTVELEETKTKKSRRSLPLVPGTERYLQELKAEQERLGLTGDKVAQWPNGRELRPDYISKAFGQLLEKNGLPKIRFHDLRHTVATLLSANGVKAKQISEFLGHESVITTLDIYTEVYDEEKEKTADKMGQIYS